MLREVFRWRFAPGDSVRLPYVGRRGRDWIGRHLQEGVVMVAHRAGRGPVQRRNGGVDGPVKTVSGPHNYGVWIDGEFVVVPGGNMRQLVEVSE